MRDSSRRGHVLRRQKKKNTHFQFMRDSELSFQQGLNAYNTIDI